MQKVLFVCLTLSSFNLVSARYGWGSCQSPALKQDFNSTKYLGLWYELYRDIDIPFEKNAICVTADYGETSTPGMISVYNRNFDPSQYAYEDVTGTATCDGAQCLVKFGFFGGGDYRIVDTDYDNYALVFSCSDFYFFHVEFAWILTRTTRPSY